MSIVRRSVVCLVVAMAMVVMMAGCKEKAAKKTVAAPINETPATAVAPKPMDAPKKADQAPAMRETEETDMGGEDTEEDYTE